MALVGSVAVGFKGDTRGLDAAAQQAIKQLDHVTKQVHGMKSALQEGFGVKMASGSGLAGLAGLLKGGAAVLAVKQMAGFMASTAVQADKLAASGASIDRIFGKGSASVHKTIEDMASQFGMARQASQQASVQIGATLRNAGLSTQQVATENNNLLRSAADMAAATGFSTGEAITAIASALRGEYDPIEKFGVGIKAAAVEQLLMAKGAEKVNGEYSQQAKAMAVLELFYGQTAALQGAAAANSDTASGAIGRLSTAWEKASETAGKFFAPAVKTVAEAFTWATDIMDKFFQGLRWGQYLLAKSVGDMRTWEEFKGKGQTKAVEEQKKSQSEITREQGKQVELAEKMRKAQTEMIEEQKKAKWDELGKALQGRSDITKQIAQTRLEKQFGANADVMKLLGLKGQLGEGGVMDLARQMDAANGMVSEADMEKAGSRRAGLAMAGSREAFNLELAARTGSDRDGGVAKNTASTADTLKKILDYLKGNPEVQMGF